MAHFIGFEEETRPDVECEAKEKCDVSHIAGAGYANCTSHTRQCHVSADCLTASFPRLVSVAENNQPRCALDL